MIRKGDFLMALADATLLNNAREVEELVFADIGKKIGESGFPKADIEFSRIVNDPRSFLKRGRYGVDELIAKIKEMMKVLGRLGPVNGSDRLMKRLERLSDLLKRYSGIKILKEDDYQNIRELLEELFGYQSIRAMIMEFDISEEDREKLLKLLDEIRKMAGALRRIMKVLGVFIAPVKVIVFLKNIEEVTSSDDEAEARVLSTLIHELLHHVHHALVDRNGLKWSCSIAYTFDYLDIIMESLARYYQMELSKSFQFDFPAMIRVLDSIVRERRMSAYEWSYSGAYFIEDESHFVKVLTSSVKAGKGQYGNWVNAIKALLSKRLGDRPKMDDIRKTLMMPA